MTRMNIFNSFLCRVPMEIPISGKARGWFRAERIAITKIPKKFMFASAWRYKAGTKQTACHGAMAVALRTEGENKWSYGHVPSAGWLGLGGGWIVE